MTANETYINHFKSFINPSLILKNILLSDVYNHKENISEAFAPRNLEEVVYILVRGYILLSYIKILLVLVVYTF